jgi:hypothetical protein
MRPLRKGFGAWPQRLAMLGAALAIGGFAASYSQADPRPTVVREAQRADAVPDRLLTVPANPRISNDPYSSSMLCANSQERPSVTNPTPTFAATLESVAPPGSGESSGTPAPASRHVVFEVTKPTGEPVVRENTDTLNSHTAAYQIPAGKLANGEYQWRVRVQDASAMSDWTAWCGFTVRLPSEATP